MYLHAFAVMYGEHLRGSPSVICVVGALLGLLISGRKEHADGTGSPRAAGLDKPGAHAMTAGR